MDYCCLFFFYHLTFIAISIQPTCNMNTIRMISFQNWYINISSNVRVRQEVMDGCNGWQGTSKYTHIELATCYLNYGINIIIILMYPGHHQTWPNSYWNKPKVKFPRGLHNFSSNIHSKWQTQNTIPLWLFIWVCIVVFTVSWY